MRSLFMRQSPRPHFEFAVASTSPSRGWAYEATHGLFPPTILTSPPLVPPPARRFELELAAEAVAPGGFTVDDPTAAGESLNSSIQSGIIRPFPVSKSSRPERQQPERQLTERQLTERQVELARLDPCRDVPREDE